MGQQRDSIVAVAARCSNSSRGATLLKHSASRTSGKATCMNRTRPRRRGLPTAVGPAEARPARRCRRSRKSQVSGHEARDHRSYEGNRQRPQAPGSPQPATQPTPSGTRGHPAASRPGAQGRPRPEHRKRRGSIAPGGQPADHIQRRVGVERDSNCRSTGKACPRTWIFWRPRSRGAPGTDATLPDAVAAAHDSNVTLPDAVTAGFREQRGPP